MYISKPCLVYIIYMIKYEKKIYNCSNVSISVFFLQDVLPRPIWIPLLADFKIAVHESCLKINYFSGNI